jgi:hypothetical protein
MARPLRLARPAHLVEKYSASFSAPQLAVPSLSAFNAPDPLANALRRSGKRAASPQRKHSLRRLG